MIARQPKQMEIWGQIVSKAWNDKNFKARLLAEPAEVFREYGLEAPSGVDLRVVESTDKVQYINLPAKPREGELSDDELDHVAGGIVAFEYLFVSTLLGLALTVGLSAKRSTNSGSQQPSSGSAAKQ